MPLKVPQIDDRKYQDLVRDALARIPIHNPEWTNFNRSDPGVTLIELFAFLTESLLYRSNQIPERNRRKFLSLLGIPLQPATPARGLITFNNSRGPLQTVPLNDDLEVRAGQVPFRTQSGLDVLPVETQIYYKRRLDDPSGQMLAQYNQLYALQNNGYLPAAPPLFYETVPLTSKLSSAGGIDLSRDTVDNSLWIAFMVRTSDTPYDKKIDEVRQAIAGKTVSLGIVPVLTNATQTLTSMGQAEQEPHLHFAIPKISHNGRLPDDYRLRIPQYLPLDANTPTDVLAQPGVVEVTLPANPQQLSLWSNLDPFETGTGEFPPALEDTTMETRLITWLRVSASPSVRVRLSWLGINTVPIIQQAYVANELLPNGTGEPDQVVTLSKTPVVSNSVRVTVTTYNRAEEWHEIDDLLAAASEVPITTPWTPLSTPTPRKDAASKVFSVDLETGDIHFGDGIHGARPPYQSILRADYAYSVGPDGNMGTGSINSCPALPPGLNVSNPIRTWGGSQAETIAEAEKQISHYLRHQDRLLSIADFETITLRTPGVDIGRVEVLPAYNPTLASNTPGNAPGAVTLMIIPRNDPNHPDTPVPDRLFLDTISAYLEPRRLITTELHLCGPVYKSIWVSLGIKVTPGAHMSQVREAVKAAIVQFLSPLPAIDDTSANGSAAPPSVTLYRQTHNGWPLRKPVAALELQAIASRVEGVMQVNGVLLAEGYNPGVHQVLMSGLELPRLAGMIVSRGDPLSLEQVRGQSDLAYASTWAGAASPGSNGRGGPGSSGGPASPGGPTGPGRAGGPNGPGGPGGSPPPRRPGNPFVPVPVVPEECR